MFKVNRYFDDCVMSMAFENEEGRATVGIMAAGEYEFSTSSIEYMTVISGKMSVLLHGETKWKDFKPYDTFVVGKDLSFKLVIEADCAYKCLYK